MLFSRNTRNIIKDVKVIVNYAKHSTNMSNNLKGYASVVKLNGYQKERHFV